MKQEIREILEKLRINEENIKAIKKSGLELIKDEENILKVKIPSNVAYDLYCDNFLEDNDEVEEVNLLDIVYSEGMYATAYNYAKRHETRIINDTFDSECVSHLTALVCYILTKINDYRYQNLKSINDVTEPIPIQVFLNLVNSNKNIKVSITDDEGNTFAGQLQNIRIEHSMFSGPKIIAVINIISKAPEGYVKANYGIGLPYIPFISRLEDLGLTVIETGDNNYKKLTERGRKYIELTEKPKYCEYHGFAYSQGWMADERHRIDSRIMIDINAFKMLNPNINSDWFAGDAAYSKNLIGNIIDEKYLWMCSPVVYGFSFDNKTWCRFSVSDISEIKFSEKAFDDLIIPEENKAIFTASLTHDMPSLDAISNKGAGKIFLLYGAPGVGKTMTAESVAEFLKKPLYFVSVGELGTSPARLEESLDRIMKIAQSWDAIILLDEVDVFAVDRLGTSIERNAMTAIFLRMLERYSGVMFMTTNLKDNLDPAFISRATATIEYKSLTEKDREQIWLGILNKANSIGKVIVDNSVYEAIKEHAMIDINGRVIKNTIRLAYTLALTTEDKVLRNSHILSAIKLRG